jgi:hypothetical protein
LPWLEVLDLHAVTDAEHRQAAAVFGHQGGSAQVAGETLKPLPTIAFGQRVPEVDVKLKKAVPEVSVLEQELVKVSRRTTLA